MRNPPGGGDAAGQGRNHKMIIRLSAAAIAVASAFSTPALAAGTDQPTVTVTATRQAQRADTPARAQARQCHPCQHAGAMGTHHRAHAAAGRPYVAGTRRCFFAVGYHGRTARRRRGGVWCRRGGVRRRRWATRTPALSSSAPWRSASSVAGCGSSSGGAPSLWPDPSNSMMRARPQ